MITFIPEEQIRNVNMKLLLIFVIVSVLIFSTTVSGDGESQSSSLDYKKELELLLVIDLCDGYDLTGVIGNCHASTDLAIGDSGNIYVADYGGKRIQIFDSLGKVIQTIELRGWPHGITLDKDENIYVTEWWDWEGVEKFTKTSEPASTFSHFPLAATDFEIEDQSVFGLPADIVVDPDGIVYVLKSHNSGGKTFSGMGVHKISADGGYLEFLPVPETVTVPHSGAAFMTIDKEGYLYLVDQKGSNIIILDPSNGNVKVLDFEFGRAYGPSKEPLEYSGHIQGIAFNPEGFMFVAESASIHVFDEYHLPITTIGEYGTEDGKLSATHGLEFDKDGNMYVLDYDNSRLQVFHIDPKVFGSLIYEETEEVAPYTPETEVTDSGGGCLIATAAFGSEMAPQVQSLRELRDNIVLQTESGTSFMTGFNQFYYSFSPVIADYERENPVFKEAVKLTLTPLLTSLTLLQYADIDSESEMLGYGIGIILLNIGMYFVAPAVLIMKIRTSYNKIVK